MPQRLKTDPDLIATAEALPEISESEHEFCRQRALGKNASDAVRASRDCTNWAPATIWAKASVMDSDARLRQWTDAYRAAGLVATGRTLEHHIRELERLKKLALESGNIGAALGCEQTIGKATGLHIDRVQEVPADPMDTLRTIAQHQPDLAAQLAAAHNIPWSPTDHATKH